MDFVGVVVIVCSICTSNCDCFIALHLCPVASTFRPGASARVRVVTHLSQLRHSETTARRAHMP